MERSQIPKILPLAVEHAGHRHILEIIRAEDQAKARLLDMGCGTGKILALVATHFPETDCYGYDVIDSDVQPAGYGNETLARLSAARPDIDWSNRVSFIPSSAGWPSPTASSTSFFLIKS